MAEEKNLGIILQEDLKCCPFCGMQAQLTHLESYKEWYLSCTYLECPMKPFRCFSNAREAIEAWNKRV